MLFSNSQFPSSLTICVGHPLHLYIKGLFLYVFFVLSLSVTTQLLATTLFHFTFSTTILYMTFYPKRSLCIDTALMNFSLEILLKCFVFQYRYVQNYVQCSCRSLWGRNVQHAQTVHVTCMWCRVRQIVSTDLVLQFDVNIYRKVTGKSVVEPK